MHDHEQKACEDSEEEDDDEDEQKEKLLEDVFHHVRKKVWSDVKIAKDQIEIVVKVRRDLLS